jgi:hypothetical protein
LVITALKLLVFTALAVELNLAVRFNAR